MNIKNHNLRKKSQWLFSELSSEKSEPTEAKGTTHNRVERKGKAHGLLFFNPSISCRFICICSLIWWVTFFGR